jgi:hypothetical protein
MEQSELSESVANQSANANDALAAPTSSAMRATSALTPQSCPTCGAVKSANNGPGSAPSYVYALGKIAPRFPSPSVDKEFAQVVGRDDTKKLTDPMVLHKILSDRHNRYLVRKLCWVMTVEGLETYILVPRDPADYDLLIESLRATPQPTDLDVAIGMRGPIAPPEMCNGLMVPIVAFDQLYSFDRDSLIKAIPEQKADAKKRPADEEFAPAAGYLFDFIMQMTDNAGAMDEHRALNYLAVRYRRIYEAVAEAFGRNESLSAVDVRSSALSGTRKVFEVIFSFTNRNTDVVSKQFVRVDVTEEFPFLVTKLSPYYDR